MRRRVLRRRRGRRAALRLERGAAHHHDRRGPRGFRAVGDEPGQARLKRRRRLLRPRGELADHGPPLRTSMP